MWAYRIPDSRTWFLWEQHFFFIVRCIFFTWYKLSLSDITRSSSSKKLRGDNILLDAFSLRGTDGVFQISPDPVHRRSCGVTTEDRNRERPPQYDMAHYRPTTPRLPLLWPPAQPVLLNRI